MRMRRLKLHSQKYHCRANYEPCGLKIVQDTGHRRFVKTSTSAHYKVFRLQESLEMSRATVARSAKPKMERPACGGLQAEDRRHAVPPARDAGEVVVPDADLAARKRSSQFETATRAKRVRSVANQLPRWEQRVRGHGLKN